MKTTLDLNDTLLAEAKVLAAKQRTTLTRVVEEGLRMRLRAPKPAKAAAAKGTFVFPIVHGKGGMHAGIDPRSNRSMLEAMEGDDA